MKQMIYSIALVFGLLIAVPGSGMAEEPQQLDGYIQQVDVRGSALIMGGKYYPVARNVTIHGFGINATLADLQPRTGILYRVKYNPQTKRKDLITEIWLKEM